MKLLRMLTYILLAVTAVVLAVSTIIGRVTEDNTVPTITCPDTPLVISVSENSREVLCSGVEAYDKKDGDLTDRILVEVDLKESGTAQVKYAVVDNDDHVATAVREVQYTDYHAPRFHLSGELRYPVGSSSISLGDRLTAEDCIDGDLSSLIKLTVTSISTTAEGSYPITVEVTNSIGDTSTLTLDVVIDTYQNAEPAIRLTDYIVYLQEGEAFSPEDYLKSAENAELSEVTAELPEGGLQKGVNKVTYSVRGESGIEGYTTLYVIVE